MSAQWTKIRILVTTVVTVVKCCSETWALRKTGGGGFAICFPKNCLRIVLNTRLIGPISNSKLQENCDSIQIPRPIMIVRLRFFWLVLRIRDERLPKIFMSADYVRKYLKEIKTICKGVNWETLNVLRRRRSVRTCIGLRHLDATVSCK